MKLKDATRKNIISYLEGFLQGLVNKYDPDVVKDAVIKQVLSDPESGRYKPFHVALIPPHFLRLHSFFRSFDTSLGQGVFEYIAQLIAADNPVWAKAEWNYTLTVSTDGGIQETIATFIRGGKEKEEETLSTTPVALYLRGSSDSIEG